MPTRSLDDAIAIRDHLLENNSAYTATRIWVQLNACCKWAKRSKLIFENPFIDMRDDFRVNITDPDHLKDIDSFLEEEIALVLLIAIAYTAATMNGQKIKRWGIEKYVGRVKEADRTEPRHSHFYIGLYGQTWVQFMAPYAEIVAELLQLSPHKQPYYRKGMRATRLIQSAL